MTHHALSTLVSNEILSTVRMPRPQFWLQLTVVLYFYLYPGHVWSEYDVWLCLQIDQSAGVSGGVEWAEQLRVSERAAVGEHDGDHLCGTHQKPSRAPAGTQERECDIISDRVFLWVMLRLGMHLYIQWDKFFVVFLGNEEVSAEPGDVTQTAWTRKYSCVYLNK